MLEQTRQAFREALKKEIDPAVRQWALRMLRGEDQARRKRRRRRKAPASS